MVRCSAPALEALFPIELACTSADFFLPCFLSSSLSFDCLCLCKNSSESTFTAERIPKGQCGFDTYKDIKRRQELEQKVVYVGHSVLCLAFVSFGVTLRTATDETRGAADAIFGPGCGAEELCLQVRQVIQISPTWW